MALKRTTVMLDEDDLAVIKAAARREGRPEAEFIREAVHLRALRARDWSGDDWEIPSFDFGGPMTDEAVGAIVIDEFEARA